METVNTTTARGKRTNSLAFAQTDCHTCTTLGDKCDRRRPRCSTCLDQDRECGGFATSLFWNPKRMMSTNNSSKAKEVDGEGAGFDVSARNDQSLSSEQRAPPFRFRFVSGPSKRRKRQKAHSPCANSIDKARPNPNEDPLVQAEKVPPSSAGEVLERTSGDQAGNCLDRIDTAFSNPELTSTLTEEIGAEDRFSVINNFHLWDSFMPTAYGPTNLFDFGAPDSLETEDLSHAMSLAKTPLSLTERDMGLSLEGAIPQDFSSMFPDDETPKEISSTGEVHMPFKSPCFTATTFLDPSSKDQRWLFELYDSDFCVLPLTSDITINPFRCKPQNSRDSRLLFHAILALCYRHLNCLNSSWSNEMHQHRGKAIQLLESALKDVQSQNCLHLLQPILILFTLDCTFSATGNWINHLERARSMLQGCGGPSALTAPRMRSQVAMLFWWDATLALISRQHPVLDREYLEYLVQWERQDEWSFFDLTGCPRDLLVILFDLAELARQSEIATSMEWLSFNISPVIEAERNLNGWINDLDPSQQDCNPNVPNLNTERDFHNQQDRFHCAEAWRNALLLYIDSVFRRDCQKRAFPRIQTARRTLDHIRCCRQSSQTQKQLLLPIFLAASETSDHEMREFVKGYCTYWADKSRYSMFTSVITILDEIWETGEWWGSVIDKKSNSTSPGFRKGATQLLLG